ncbi:WGR domain-containing protein [Sinorhizobium meliloti]|uniref:WGR domain-containing protein n=1 Tax=Rhizobium meliloti TaxID=382 RepID=UPI0003A536D6
MLTQPYPLYIERTDATKTVARFYTLPIEPTLSGTPCLTWRWSASGHGASLRQGRGCCAHDHRSAADQTGARLKTENTRST